MKSKSSILGYPRMGAKRELKKALESYWKGKGTIENLLNEAKEIRTANLEKNSSLDSFPVGDFSFYDQILDMSTMLEVVPEAYQKVPSSETGFNFNQYFAQARGYQKEGLDLPALAMTKWFDTNYHYIVPVFSSNQSFTLNAAKLIGEIKEAVESGKSIKDLRPVVVGPVTYLLLGRLKEGSPLLLLDKLLPLYIELLEALSKLGVETIQIDEPFLALDLGSEEREAYTKAYSLLSNEFKKSGVKLFLATYFEEVDYEFAFNLGADILHLDLVRSDFNNVLAKVSHLPKETILSCGIVDGRNIWKNDLSQSIDRLEKIVEVLGRERVWVGSSCSLLHSPVDATLEKMNERVLSVLSFAVQKVEEITLLTKGLNQGREAIATELKANRDCLAQFRESDFVRNATVQSRMEDLKNEPINRPNKYAIRRERQKESLGLPTYPSTTIGSFPQTPALRKKRLEFKRGNIDKTEYENFVKQLTRECIEWQDSVGLDVLVHGEFERNDMVEYFGENLDGFAFTSNGWVQSYGSRCVKPPIIYGDISRATAMTVAWSEYASSLTNKPMKAMLTGPVTILKWSFVREDQPWEITSKQLALALRDEVLDLESHGLKIIQIDEAAFREALPLKKSKQADYLNWAVESFKITVAKVKDATQIHTHMCYSDFNSIMDSIIAMDADVISIEASRSDLKIFSAFKEHHYPNEIGLGVYDIHSPRVPSVEEMAAVVKVAKDYLKEEQIWINPDCGLKTRGWDETKQALSNMVEVSHRQR